MLSLHSKKISDNSRTKGLGYVGKTRSGKSYTMQKHCKKDLTDGKKIIYVDGAGKNNKFYNSVKTSKTIIELNKTINFKKYDDYDFIYIACDWDDKSNNILGLELLKEKLIKGHNNNLVIYFDHSFFYNKDIFKKLIENIRGRICYSISCQSIDELINIELEEMIDFYFVFKHSTNQNVKHWNEFSLADYKFIEKELIDLKFGEFIPYVRNK